MNINELLANKIFTVSEFNDFVNEVLKPLSATIEGEVADFRVSQGKFVWFMLKDADQSLQCFTLAFRLRQPIEDGMKVKVSGHPRIYGKSGRYSFFVEKIEISGEGSLKRAYEILRSKLEMEGLFAAERKRALPRFPQTIGLITSKDAAAYTDFITHLKARFGGLVIKFVPCAVQGENAVAEIILAFDFFNAQKNKPDVVILTRGGGSLEDLAAFNSEEIARAVFSSKIPTIVGVGHERDISLCELAADQRASTPTHAAQLVVPSRNDILQEINENLKMSANQVREKFNDMEWRLGHLIQELSETITARLKQIHRQIAEFNFVFQTFESRVKNSLFRQTNLLALLCSLSPKNVLARGYSIVRKSGTIVRQASELTAGDNIEIQPGHGLAEAKVTKVNYADKEKK